MVPSIPVFYKNARGNFESKDDNTFYYVKHSVSNGKSYNRCKTRMSHKCRAAVIIQGILITSQLAVNNHGRYMNRGLREYSYYRSPRKNKQEARIE